MDENVCGWCGVKMNPEAVKCPNCRKWRKDIYKERIIYYTFLAFSSIFLIIAVRNGFVYNLFSGANFSFKVFFRSIFTWIFIVMFIPTLVYYSKISKKLGTWWWV